MKKVRFVEYDVRRDISHLLQAYFTAELLRSGILDLLEFQFLISQSFPRIKSSFRLLSAVLLLSSLVNAAQLSPLHPFYYILGFSFQIVQPRDEHKLLIGATHLLSTIWLVLLLALAPPGGHGVFLFRRV
jgi:hypothetical protein